ncbi:MAG: hypothetical protein QN163_06750 [Armatimonadota bacterium]|nr:hypothetical protein [Armatimonadota bacterium]MDR5698137.1 hypothetical protein [Armatimonadota bacterium]
MYPLPLIERCRAVGLRWFAGIRLFCDPHARGVLRRRPELWPIGETGRRQVVSDWYVGVIPTDASYVRERGRSADRVLSLPVDGLMLDFLRWPMCWEREIRPGAARSIQYSFDDISVRRFQADTGLPIRGASTAERARFILARHRGL